MEWQERCCIPLFAVIQGWTSTAWLVANTELTPRHRSPVFTAAISHFVAFGILFSVAACSCRDATYGWRQLPSTVKSVPYKIAFLAGLGWTSTLAMVCASPVLGVALVQVLVVSGELSTAAAIDVLIRREHPVRTSMAVLLVVLGVVLNVLGEVKRSGSAVHWAQVATWAAAAFGCGMCLALYALGSTHLRKFIGAANATAWSAFIASTGNAAIWVIADLHGVHFHSDTRSSTYLLWLIVGAASSWNVFVSTFVPGRIGFAFTFVLIVAGKVSSGLLVDALGILSRKRPVSLLRVLGMTSVFWSTRSVSSAGSGR
eukprot:gnl/TRDRNA2_/TRDRNA2_74176_c0_seq1.p1 gnl/TRDRNA2_/TRDRNA2_74176_c0~~gnl/TRDRNA2_/TRDRNA2_74176_c0_seq1.p1  ORF type:complete len:315 (+),score=36.65 gnl/TRDRNA2_/TRDRNA2_74176_c0_seq1:67-1011(+)